MTQFSQAPHNRTLNTRSLSKMEWTLPESVLSNRQRVMEELVQGREMADQLWRVLGGDVGSSEGLATKILGSFTNILFILNENQEAKEELISLIQANSTTSTVAASGAGVAASGSGVADSSSWDIVHDDSAKSEYSNEESCKSTENLKDRRGSYKRRKITHSWTKDALDLVDDGHAWRKYGHKTILNTSHPRNYFRCTHKFDQACKATKHVQKIKDEPQLYRTTYYGNHTCTDYLKAPELILDCSSPGDSSKNMIRFHNTDNDSTRKFLSSLTSIKTESDMGKITPVSDHDHLTHHNQSSPLCDVMSPVLGVFESFGPISGFTSMMQYDILEWWDTLMMK